jgi:hypothetical protein
MLDAVRLPDALQQLSERRVVLSAQYGGNSFSYQRSRRALKRCFVGGPDGADGSLIIDQQHEFAEQSCEGPADTAS